ncbi:MAG: GIY-YIG nuclease family protein [Bacteroidota bacterium]
MFTTYILWSGALQKYYVGHTDNLKRRLEEHNTSRSVYTKTGIPWVLVYHQEFDTRKNAVRRELEIKKRKSRRYIERLIAGQSVPSC